MIMADNAGEDVLRQQMAKKTYVFSVSRRFAYVKQCTTLKRIEQEKENPLFRQIRTTIYKFIGRKEEG